MKKKLPVSTKEFQRVDILSSSLNCSKKKGNLHFFFFFLAHAAESVLPRVPRECKKAQIPPVVTNGVIGTEEEDDDDERWGGRPQFARSKASTGVGEMRKKKSATGKKYTARKKGGEGAWAAV